MRPAQLLPGDVLVHHDKSLMGQIMGWGEWDGAAQEDLQATHIELVLDRSSIAKMNPPVSSTYPLDSAPWDSITVYRLTVPTVGTPGLDPEWIAAFQAECREHLGEKYDWGQIARFTWIGLVARFWPSKAQQMMRDGDPSVVTDGHGGVCSEWAQARLERSLVKVYGLSQFDLFDGIGIGKGGARPSDWQRSRYLVAVNV